MACHGYGYGSNEWSRNSVRLCHNVISSLPFAPLSVFDFAWRNCSETFENVREWSHITKRCRLFKEERPDTRPHRHPRRSKSFLQFTRTWPQSIGTGRECCWWNSCLEVKQSILWPSVTPSRNCGKNVSHLHDNVSSHTAGVISPKHLLWMGRCADFAFSLGSKGCLGEHDFLTTKRDERDSWKEARGAWVLWEKYLHNLYILWKYEHFSIFAKSCDLTCWTTLVMNYQIQTEIRSFCGSLLFLNNFFKLFKLIVVIIFLSNKSMIFFP